MINNPVQYDDRGRIVAIQCKLCGGRIAYMANGRFHRAPNYTEMKISFSDGSNHVTHGCKHCFTHSLSPETLEDMTKVDLGSDERIGAKISVIDHSQQGVI